MKRDVISRVPEIHPVSDLAKKAHELIESARQRQEAMIITQRGRQAAVLVPIELYREMERMLLPEVVSPHLVHPEDAKTFQMEMTVVDTPQKWKTERRR